MAKGSNVEVEERVFTVAKLMLDGMRRSSDIIRHCTEKTDWGVKTRQIEHYIARAKELITLENEKDLEFSRNLAVSQLDELIRKNLKDGDLREARNCIKDKASMLGLIESRFAGKVDKKESKLTVVSRFADKWEKIKGG